MSAKQSKRPLIMNILDILKKYTDEEHRLSQKEIVDILKTEYNMTIDRKAIRRNILNLMDCGYNIEYTETIRMVSNAKTGEVEESYSWSDFYLEREFTNGELRLLIDGLLFSEYVPTCQRRELVKKLEGLSNMYFHSRVNYIACLPLKDRADNKQLFLILRYWTRQSVKNVRCLIIIWNMVQIKNYISKNGMMDQREITLLVLIRWRQGRENII